MGEMFNGATAFNQPVSTLDTSKVTNVSVFNFVLSPMATILVPNS